MTADPSMLWPEPLPDAGGDERYVEVALKLPLKVAFTYRLAPQQDARPGNRVRVPFRGKDLPGVVVRLRADCGDVPPAKVRVVRDVLDRDLVLPESLLALAGRMAQDYGCSLGEALDAMLPAAAKQRGVRKIPHVELAIGHDEAQQLADELEAKHEQRAR